MKKITFTLLVWCLVSPSVFISEFATAGEVSLMVEKYTVQLGESIGVELSVTGDLDGEPQFPDVPGMSVRSAGRSSNVSIINGDISKSLVLKYILAFSKPGSYRIPKVRLKIDNQYKYTKPFQINVKKVSSLSQSQIQEQKPLFFIKRKLSNETPYVGEPVVEDIKIYRRIDWRGASRFGEDNVDLKYFEVKGTKESREEIGGTLYGVTTLTRVFVPMKPGVIELGSFGVEVQYQGQTRTRRSLDPFDMFGRGSLATKKILAPSVTIGVNTLPKKNKPSDFSGFVGDVDLIGSLSERELKTGDTSTLTIKVEGTGWITSLDLKTPSIDDSIFKIYPDRPESTENISHSGISGHKSLKFALVPVQEGSYGLGEYKFSYFSPTQKKYITKTVNLGSVNVEKGEDTSLTSNLGSSINSGPMTKSKLKASGSDIFDLKRDIDLDSGSISLSLILYLSSGFILIYILVTETKVLYARIGRDPTTRKNYIRLLKGAKKAASKNDISLLFDCFKEFVSKENSLELGSVTYKDVELYFNKLDSKLDNKIDNSEILGALSSAEASKYGKSVGQKNFDFSKIVNSIKKLNL